jgi:CRP/FNR family transcriptional regulator
MHADIFQLLTRKDLADFAGIATESTVKILKSLEKDGIIALKEKDILILDTDRLIAISKNG